MCVEHKQSMKQCEVSCFNKPGKLIYRIQNIITVLNINNDNNKIWGKKLISK